MSDEQIRFTPSRHLRDYINAADQPPADTINNLFDDWLRLTAINQIKSHSPKESTSTKSNNRNFLLICSIFSLDRNDIHEIMNGKYSKSQIDGWRRGENSEKKATGSSGSTSKLRRYRPMSDEQFSEFCVCLKPWLDAQDAQE